MKQGYFYLQHQAARKSEQENICKVLSGAQGTQKVLTQCQPWLVKKKWRARDGVDLPRATSLKASCLVQCCASLTPSKEETDVSSKKDSWISQRREPSAFHPSQASSPAGPSFLYCNIVFALWVPGTLVARASELNPMDSRPVGLCEGWGSTRSCLTSE